MQVQYSEIRQGDVGVFTDGTIWIAIGEFVADGHVDKQGHEWGAFPIHTPISRYQGGLGLTTKADQADGSHIRGTKTTVTTLIHRMVS